MSSKYKHNIAVFDPFVIGVFKLRRASSTFKIYFVLLIVLNVTCPRECRSSPPRSAHATRTVDILMEHVQCNLNDIRVGDGCMSQSVASPSVPTLDLIETSGHDTMTSQPVVNSPM